MSKTQRLKQQAKAEQKKQKKYSRPTMCLHCHLIVEMIRGEESWSCPRCAHLYFFKHWNIRTRGDK